jgi:hypothetical protein
MILGAQLSNSFIILLVLSGESRSSSSSLTATEISKAIATRTNGKLFEVPATLQDSIGKRLKREGLVEAKKPIPTRFVSQLLIIKVGSSCSVVNPHHGLSK